MSRKSDKKGFTLAEMLIALAVIGVIAAITMPLLHKIIPTKEDTTKKKADYLVQQIVNQLYDDDIMYPKNMLSQLLRCHARHPKDVCANRIRTIKIEDSSIAPYPEWQLSEKRLMPRRHGYKNFFCGVGGVLYPPKSLHPDVLNNQKFMKLCPNQDDVWFWAMAVLNKRKISVTRFGYNLHERTVTAVQSVGLWNTINSATTNPNNTAIANVINEYPAIAMNLGLQ